MSCRFNSTYRFPFPHGNIHESTIGRSPPPFVSSRPSSRFLSAQYSLLLLLLLDRLGVARQARARAHSARPHQPGGRPKRRDGPVADREGGGGERPTIDGRTDGRPIRRVRLAARPPLSRSPCSVRPSQSSCFLQIIALGFSGGADNARIL